MSLLLASVLGFMGAAFVTWLWCMSRVSMKYKIQAMQEELLMDEIIFTHFRGDLEAKREAEIKLVNLVKGG